MAVEGSKRTASDGEKAEAQSSTSRSGLSGFTELSLRHDCAGMVLILWGSFYLGSALGSLVFVKSHMSA